MIGIYKIPYEDETFDIVIANRMLYHVANINTGLTEVLRVLKRGRTFYCATFGEYGIMKYISKIFAPYIGILRFKMTMRF